MSDWNDKIIAEFREHAGRTEQFGNGLVILHTTGARSGRERVNPVAAQSLEGGARWAVFASKAGADTHPDWFHNLRAHPDIEIEVGDGRGVETVPVRARVLEGSERETVWEEQKRRFPGFADYEQKTTREIPVVELVRR